MTQKGPDLAKALVSPMPLHLPFPVPSLFAWVIGMVLAWALLLFVGYVLQDSAAGRWVRLVVPAYLAQSVVILLILLLHTGAAPIFSITTPDLLIGLLWGAAVNGWMLLLWFCLVFRWQFAEAEPRSPLVRPTSIRNNTSLRQARSRPTSNTAPSYSIAGNTPKTTRARKSLPKRKRLKSHTSARSQASVTKCFR